MKTNTTLMAVFATLLFSQAANAKMGSNPTTPNTESRISINVEAEIVNNINKMLANATSPSVKADATKQLKNGSVKIKTNELVQAVSEKLPEFKFKVVIAD